MTNSVVLVYHAVSDEPLPRLELYTTNPSRYREHLGVLSASGRPLLSVAELTRRRSNGTSQGNEVVVTVDDGFVDALAAVRDAVQLGVPGTLFVTTSFIGAPGMLSAADLCEVAAYGWEVGSHAATHRHLDELSSAQVRQELQTSKQTLQDILDAPVVSFSYPHGAHTAAIRRAVAGAGYSAAVAVANNPSRATESALKISRLTVTATTSAADVQGWLNGSALPSHPPGAAAWWWGHRALRRFQAARHGSRDELADVLELAGAPRG